MIHMTCEHKQWHARSVPLSDGRNSLREFCVACGKSNGGTRLGIAIPMTSDADIQLPSFKYGTKTLGEILAIDRQYLIWIVKESKTSDRFKKSAARLLTNTAYTPPVPGHVYSRSLCYRPGDGVRAMDEIINNPPVHNPPNPTPNSTNDALTNGSM